MDGYRVKQQLEFATKLLAIQKKAVDLLSPVGWFLLTSALCRMGEPSVTVFPSLSHSRSAIERLGPTYVATLASLSEQERAIIQTLYRQFVNDLSYGKPSTADLRD